MAAFGPLRYAPAPVNFVLGLIIRENNDVKMTFHGLNRMVYSHSHEVTPGRYGRGKRGEPLEWSSFTTAYGRVYGLSLGGNFRVQFDFEPLELKSWISAYVQEHPADALKLLAEMHAAAIIALSERKGEEEAED